MTEPGNTTRRSSPVLWMLATVLMAALALWMAWSVLEAIRAGELMVTRGRRNPVKYLVTFRDRPGEFSLQVAYRMIFIAILGLFAQARINVWRRRKDTGRAAWDKELARVEQTSSKTGNVIAWILLAPFALILLLVVAGMILRATQ